MGGTSYSAPDWTRYSSSVATKTRAEIFTRSDLDPALDPSKFKVRESCDSDVNPESTPIMIFVDETGSMGNLAEAIIRKDLGIIMGEVNNRKPVKYPHFLCGGVGDCECDEAPIQATQFEADSNSLVPQIEKIYLEGGGGGNYGESYPLAWVFAQHKTRCDAIIKRKKKGFLFTIGDERALPKLSKAHVKRFLDVDLEGNITIKELLNQVTQNWEVFHLIVPTSATASQGAVAAWKELLDERAIVIDGGEKLGAKLGAIIVSTLQVLAGEDLDTVADSWDGSTAIVVKNSLKGLQASNNSGAVATL